MYAAHQKCISYSVCKLGFLDHLIILFISYVPATSQMILLKAFGAVKPCMACCFDKAIRCLLVENRESLCHLVFDGMLVHKMDFS